jgi:hypothetical protein
MPDGPIPVTPAQLLLLDPNAYVNLIGLFPLPDNVKTLDDVPAFELPVGFKLLQVGPREVVLVRRTPPGLFAYDRKAFEWKPVQLADEKR